MIGIFKKEREKGLLSVEILTLAYAIFTSIIIALNYHELSDVNTLITNRCLAVGGIFVLSLAYHIYPCRIGVLIRSLFVFALLILWYPETYTFSVLYPNLDHVFAGLDQYLFGCQPSLEFSRLLPDALWSEAFNFGYYAYYYIMVIVMMFYMLFRYKRFDWAGYVFLGTFFIYYVIFDFLPVAGPQFYFKAIGTDIMWAPENFPQLGYYFKNHLEAMSNDVYGIFGQLVLGAQEVGERPTAAFPSSHVGMTTVMMILAWKSRNRWLFWILVPVCILLYCATVYIKAHYLVDSLAGFVTAFLFYALANWSYKYIGRKKPLGL